MTIESALDHLVVTAPSREEGVAYVSAALGLTLQTGGEHAWMGTYNALVRLGDAAYLEVIAANPSAPAPSRPRWFGLDRAAAAARPRLATWVVRTNDVRAAAAHSPVSLGPVEAMARGSFEWLITIPGDGSLPMDGCAPHLIQWSTPKHPAASLSDARCSLLGLAVRHPRADDLRAFLHAIGFGGPVDVAAPSPGRRPGLEARFQTPGGIRVLADPHDLSRFVRAQEDVYERALSEIRSGEKRSHWMWYIFPQIEGLGSSPTSRRYAIRSPAEAEAYLRHPVLGPRLLECAEAALGVEGRSASEIFGSPDDWKLRSCATLFACASPAGSVFHRLLDKYFHGERDAKTLGLLGIGPGPA